MARVKTGIHYIPTHGRPEDDVAIRGVPATSLKVVYSGSPDRNHLRHMLSIFDGPVIVRNHARSEQKDDIWRDPVGTGIRHAREWAADLAGFDYGRLIVEGINEFPIWEAGGESAQLQYELAFGQEGLRIGLPTLHGEFAVGWPGNGGIADAPPNWLPWMPLLTFIRDNPGRYLGLHEYWGFNKGVHFYEGWWAFRYRKVPIKVPTFLTEWGGLKAYENPDGSWGLSAADGWIGDIDPYQYQVQWQEAESELLKDPEILGAHVFTTDGGHPWIDQCDAGPCNKYFASWATDQPIVPEAPGRDQLASEDILPNPDTGRDTDPPRASGGILDPYVLEAIMMVESGGAGFNTGGRLIIRTEAHLLLGDWIGDPDAFGEHFKAGGAPDYKGWMRMPGDGEWIEYHELGQNGEWAAFKLASSINPHIAKLATSMGASQVMGFNHQRIGYATVEDQWNAFTRGMPAHVAGIVNYILSDPDLVTAVRNRDWLEIGRRYNGSSAAGHKYEAAWKRLVG